MTFFVTRRQNPAESCPAGGINMGSMLLQHLSHENAIRAGIQIRGEAVVQGHTLFMILTVSDLDAVQQFMAPFA